MAPRHVASMVARRLSHPCGHMHLPGARMYSPCATGQRSMVLHCSAVGSTWPALVLGPTGSMDAAEWLRNPTAVRCFPGRSSPHVQRTPNGHPMSSVTPRSGGGLLRRAWRAVDRLFSVDLTPEPLELYAFRTQRDVDAWNVFSDSSFGGLSSATLQLSSGDEGVKTAVFSGHYSKAVQENSRLIRSGYCGINTVCKRALNLRPYDFLDVRLRGDGGTYLLNVRLDQLTGGDEEVWQAPLRTSPGTWQDVRLDFRDFVFTFRGRLVQHHAPTSAGMPRHNVIAFGITFAAAEDQPDEGDFQLQLESIRAGAYTLSREAAARKAFAGYHEFREERAAGSGSGGGLGRGGAEGDEVMPRVEPPPIAGPSDPRPMA